MTRRATREGEGGTPALLWLAAGAVALGLHAGAALLILRDARPDPLDAGGGDAVTVELDPVEGDAARRDEATPTPTAEEARAAAAEAAPAEAGRKAPPPVQRPPQPQVTPPSEPEPPTTDPPAVEPPPPSAAAPDLSPPPPPRPETPTTPTTPPRATPPPETPMQAAPPAAASAGSAAAEDASPTVQRLSTARVTAWRGRLVPHLNRYRRALLDAGDGTVRVAFTVDAAGRVTARSVATSSGDAALDEAAMSLIRRASPFPAPPAGLSGPALSFVVPIHNGDPRRRSAPPNPSP